MHTPSLVGCLTFGGARATLVCAALWLLASRAGAGIVDLGLPADASGLRAAGISGNGLVITGYTFPTNQRAIRWNSVEGVQYLSGQAGATTVAGTAVNGDGTVIVGDRYAPGPSHAFRWTAAGGMFDLGSLPGSSASHGTGVSADGSVVSGYASYSSSGERPFRWTSSGGMQELGALPGDDRAEAFGISGNGQYIVGYSRNPSYTGHMVRWNGAGQIEDLGAFPGAGNNQAYAASFDGSVVVGRSQLEAFRWTSAGGLQALPRPAGVTAAIADAVSGDGSVVAGRISRTIGPFAMMWTQATGMVDLNQYLPTIGIDVTGWKLEAVTGVSADGVTLTGYGSHDGGSRGWVVTLPAPGAAAVVGTAVAAWGVRRRGAAHRAPAGCSHAR